jgi:hypothetical protein
LTLAVGVVRGTMGSGGAIVMVPVLVSVAGRAPGEAVVISLAVVGGTLVGARATHLVAPQLLMLLFAALMLVVGATMVRGCGASDRVPTCRPVLCMSIGAVIGLLTGFLGVGGGFMIVPALIFLAGIETASAIGASLEVISINSSGGLLGHLAAVPPLWRTALLYLLVAVAGMLVGARLGIAISGRTLQRAFGAMVIAVGAAIAVTTLIALA